MYSSILLHFLVEKHTFFRRILQHHRKTFDFNNNYAEEKILQFMEFWECIVTSGLIATQIDRYPFSKLSLPLVIANIRFLADHVTTF